MHNALITLAFLALFGPNSLFAQEADHPLRVGVVLSGGGAKGYAHVGVLKVLEEAGIRIDYIAGASSGAIVGGLYAVGWTPEQMDRLLHVKNMGEMIQETPDRANLSFLKNNMVKNTHYHSL
ncbi:MAG: patatin-like phospholipase family protein [Lewinellaceae bacterium]|nr:patatin-like phospholipase family protein [Lewinellaceae bacterium]